MSAHNSRRTFVSLAGATLAAAGAPPLARAAAKAAAGRTARAAAGARDAELVVLNARVHTVDERVPRAEAFAVSAGRFVAVGTSADIKALAGKGTRTLDAQGLSVVPGFIDCHNHPVGTMLLYEVLVGNPFEVEFVTIASIVDKLRARARDTPPGFWVEGYFHDDTKVKDARALNIADLDSVSREHPVVVHHRGGHTAVYNSKALALAGVTKATANPPGGTFDRDGSGNLTGRVTDRAMDVLDAAGQRQVFTAAQAAERERLGMAHISKEFARYGLTSVSHESGDLAAIQEVRARGELRHRVSYEANGAVLEAMIANGIRSGFGDEWLRFGATAEHVADGSFSERTMALRSPYPGSTNGYKGNVTEDQETLDAWVLRVHRAGIQLNCHANGDVAIDSVLTAYERALAALPVADTRPKITHCTLIDDDLLRRMKALGVVPMPFTSYAYYNSDKFHFYGEPLMRRAMAYRSFLDAGIVPAAGSDFYPGPFAPLMGMQGMVTRTGWNGEQWGLNQRVSVAEALRINTLNGAYSTHEEAAKGSVAAGKWADFVMLADDPHEVAPEKIKDIRIVRTVAGGNTVYEA